LFDYVGGTGPDGVWENRLGVFREVESRRTIMRMIVLDNKEMEMSYGEIDLDGHGVVYLT
jgi:hypothetical protein